MINKDTLELNMSDKYWRMNNLYSIVDKNSRKVKFRFTPVQQRMWDEQTGRDDWLKARQQKISTFIVLCRLDDCLFNRNWKHRTVADEKKNLAKLFKIAKYAYENLDPEIKKRITLTIDNANEMEFSNGSDFQVTLDVHSEAVSSLHFSEVAFIEAKDVDWKIQESLEAVPRLPHTKIDFETIANGAGDYFHQHYSSAKQGRNGYKAHFFEWYLETDYQLPVDDALRTIILSSLTDREKKLMKEKLLTVEQIAWRRDKISSFTGLKNEDKEMKFLVKYPEDDEECFQMSGNKVFDSSLIKYFEQNRLLVPIMRMAVNSFGNIYEDPDGCVEIFEAPLAKFEYVAAADVAKGAADGDYSPLYVLNKITGQIVARIHCHETPQMFGVNCVIVANYYNKALLAIEKNDRGHSAIDASRAFGKQIGFNNFYYCGMEHHTLSATNIIEYGFHTNAATKPTMISNFAEEFQGGYFTMLDKGLLDEMKHFIRAQSANGRFTYRAMAGFYDDCIISISIALMMIFYFPPIRNIRTTEVYKDSYQRTIELEEKTKVEAQHANVVCVNSMG